MCSIDNEKFDVDFIRRTLENLDSAGKPPHEVTMLINCLLGLIVIPFELNSSGRRKIKFFNKKVSDIQLVRELMSDAYFHPTSFDWNKQLYKPKPLTIYNLLKSIRNSIAHHRIYWLPEDGKWRSIRLYDIQEKYTENDVKGGKPHLELSIVWTIDQLKAFCDFICKSYLLEVESRPDVRLLSLDTWRSKI